MKKKRRGQDKEPTLGLAAVYFARAMRKHGCPLCRRIREAEERWIWNVLYELTGDPEVHRSFADSLGLCRGHAALMAKVVEERELVTPTSVARLYETAVAEALTRLSRPHEKIRAERKECPLCEVARETEERESWFLAKLLADPEFWAAYEGSDGLCLPHFLSIWPKVPSRVRAKFREDFQRRLSRLLRNLRELQRKERFDVDKPLTLEESTSWQEALWRLGGMSFSDPLLKRG